MSDVNNFWQDRATFNWLMRRPLRAFAWELLRRNPEYQALWSHVRAKRDFTEHAPGVNILKFNTSAVDAMSWGFIGPYENPFVDARSANVLWSPLECSSVLAVVAVANGAVSIGDMLPVLGRTCRVTVYDEGSHRQHVLIANDGYDLQLEVRGASILEAAELLPDVLSDVAGKRARSSRQLGDLLRHGVIRPALYPVTGQARRLIDTLQALDGWRAGASRRDIAVAMVGFERVREDWGSRSLRGKVHHAVKTGRALMEGGYRKFLR